MLAPQLPTTRRAKSFSTLLWSDSALENNFWKLGDQRLLKVPEIVLWHEKKKKIQARVWFMRILNAYKVQMNRTLSGGRTLAHPVV